MKPLVVCWWHRSALALTGAGPVWAEINPTPSAAAEFVARHARPRQPVLLVHYSPEIDAIATACPRGRRALLQAALVGANPALGAFSAEWSAQEPWRAGEGLATLLHLNRESVLHACRGYLHERGLSLLNAVHLPALLDVAALAPAGAPLVVLFQCGDEGLLYTVDSQGQRQLFTDATAGARERLRTQLLATLSSYPQAAPPRFITLVHGDPWPLDDLPLQPAATLPLADFLARHAPVTARRDLAAIFPPYPRVTATVAAWALAVTCFAAAAGLFLAYRSEQQAYRADVARQRHRENELEAKLGPRREAKATLDRLQAEIAALQTPPARRRAFLEQLGRTRPPVVTVREVQFLGDKWTLTGVLHEGRGEAQGAFQQWLDRLADDQPWRLAEPRPPTPLTPEFTLYGSFTP